MGNAEAREVVAQLEIHHVYGQVGSLPWLRSGSGSIDYGSESRGDLEDIASGLQTFTESREPDEQLEKMHQALEQAEQIVFLGFGYHRQNMELLQPAAGISARVIGTVYREPSPAVTVALELVSNLFAKNIPNPSKLIDFANAAGAELLTMNFSPLTA